MRVAPILFLSFTATRTRSWRWIVPLASLCLALVAMWLFLGGWNSRASGAWDRRLGNLSYGVFLGHFLGTVAMYWIAEYVYTRTGLFGVFEIPDVTEQRLRVSAFVFALIFGCLIYVLFERPFEKLRTRLRRRRRNVPVVATTVEPALETQTLVSSS